MGPTTLGDFSPWGLGEVAGQVKELEASNTYAELIRAVQLRMNWHRYGNRS
ncbi:hypothetical protein [Leptothoe sp. PORK10 BA2]|uniref:hypothetical protein n=1 Tax=Leptothoe sp. PORK10 BA2 TaxID=3110254 RepID=UPI002B20C22F|nr:hypothetical protein [Leptothoe sp. PORK10 BA2]MEA5466312.1 hypothetical protein [Leptothoe sp. PORK10 BA2]